jgi:hypothetical protein
MSKRMECTLFAFGLPKWICLKCSFGKVVFSTMRNIHNAVTDMMDTLRMGALVRDEITQDPQAPNKWLIRLESYPNSLIRSSIEIEVIEEQDGDASVCVLRRSNVGRRALFRIMTALVDSLDDTPPIPGQ